MTVWIPKSDWAEPLIGQPFGADVAIVGPLSATQRSDHPNGYSMKAYSTSVTMRLSESGVVGSASGVIELFGERIAGRASFEAVECSGEGSDTRPRVACKPDSNGLYCPAHTARPVHAVVDGAPITFGSALATIMKDSNGQRFLERLTLYPGTVTCSEARDACKRMTCVSFDAAAGAGSRRPLLRSWQPVSPRVTRPPTPGTAFERSYEWALGWVRHEKLSWDIGGKVTGEVFAVKPGVLAADAVPDHLDGSFEAVTCESGSSLNAP